MKITVEFLSLPIVTRIIGSKSITFKLRGKTVNHLLTEIIHKYGEKVGDFLLDESGKLDSVFKILLNKKEWIKREKIDKILKDGDTITIMMLIAGG